MNYLLWGFISLITVSSGDVKPDDVVSCFCQEDGERGEGFDLIELIGRADPGATWLLNNGEPLNVIGRLDLEEKLCASDQMVKHEEIDELKLKIVLDTVAFQR